MSARKPIIYLTVFLLLGLIYYFYEYKGGETRKTAEDLAKKALVFSADSVDSFSVSRRDSLGGTDSLALVRTVQGWRIACPLDAPADSSAVARLLHAAADVNLDRVVEDSAADLSLFGLDRPELTFSLRQSGADSSLRLLLGHKNPTNSYVYAASGSSPRRVLLLNSWVQSDLTKSASDLRDKKLLHFNAASVERLTLIDGDRTNLDLTRPETGGWRLEQPVQAPAEADSVKNLLQAIEAAEALSFVDSLAVQGLSAYGLDKPGLSLTLAEQKGESVRQLFVGGRTGSGDYYARRQGMQNVYVLPGSLVDHLLADPERLRDMALVHAARERIDSLALVRATGSLVLVKDTSGAWSLVAPEPSRADEPRLDGLLWDLKDLHARSFIAKPSAELERALANPLLRVTVGVSGGSTSLAFGRLSPGDSTVYARVEGSPGAAVLDSAALGRIDLGFEDLRDRKILSFDTGSITRVRLEYPDKSLELEKEGSGWTITAPEKAPAKDWKVQNLLWDLEGMNFESVAATRGSDSLSLGFGKPALRISLFKADSLKARIAFGDSLPGGRVYLRAAGNSRTFTVQKKVLEGLPSNAEELKREDEKKSAK